MSCFMLQEIFEAQSAALFSKYLEGKPAKPDRMASGALIIKKCFGFSDENTEEEVQDNHLPAVLYELCGVLKPSAL